MVGTAAAVNFRLDDFPADTPGNILSATQLWPLLKPVEERGIEYWLGITPALLDLDHWALLKKLKYAHIALHGFTHGFDHWRPNDAKGGEFQDRSALAILKCFTLVQSMLDNHLGMRLDEVKVFIPPFNVFTQPLLDVLTVLNFEIITGGPETIREGYFDLDSHDLKVVVSTGRYYDKAVKMLSEFKHSDYLEPINPICLHLTWEKTPEAINRLLDNYQEARNAT